MPSKRPAMTTPDVDADDRGDTETPAQSRGPSEGGGEKLSGGWGAAQATIDSTSSFAQSFRPEEKSQIIKFLDDIPYVAYRRHWIERSSPQGGKVNRPYTCLQSVKKECPLCKAGDKAQAVSAFNILVLDTEGTMTLKSWDVGGRLFNVLKSYSNDPKIAPLSRGFFLVSKTGNKSTTQYNVSPIRASALEEDYDVPVPSPEVVAAHERYTPEIIEIPPVKTLRDLADELTDEYD